ncbi:uncharacterized protein LOC123722267 [Papilio machaon]|uniref:uncharacterized protein LOC123722267 n=1 Tax=Papilio machaon TaxID=76193 RepID=UPI001E6655F5|nr:uncharacterized protein LOC123722267 [Papilio machaon]
MILDKTSTRWQAHCFMCVLMFSKVQIIKRFLLLVTKTFSAVTCSLSFVLYYLILFKKTIWLVYGLCDFFYNDFSWLWKLDTVFCNDIPGLSSDLFYALDKMPKQTKLKCYFGCIVDGPLHRFPKWQYSHEERFNSWKAVLSSETQGNGNAYIYNNVRICYKHFENYYQLPSHQLTRNAVPTLNLDLPENLQRQPIFTTTATPPTKNPMDSFAHPSTSSTYHSRQAISGELF